MDKDSIGILLEFCKGGDLFTAIHHRKLNFNLKQKLKIVLDISSGIWYLHNLCTPIIHRDLSSKNILFINEFKDECENPFAKITDFGISRICDFSGVMTSNIGTKGWSAPEVSNGSKYGISSDIYSFGILLWEIFSEKDPSLFFQDFNEILNMKNKILYLNKNTPSEIINLILLCLSSADKRPKIEEIGRKIKSLYDELIINER